MSITSTCNEDPVNNAAFDTILEKQAFRILTKWGALNLHLFSYKSYCFSHTTKFIHVYEMWIETLSEIHKCIAQYTEKMSSFV